MSQVSNSGACISYFQERVSELIEARRFLHAHPELSYQEHATSTFVADRLEGWGYDVTRNVGGLGVVAQIRNGTGKRSIALRADMDGLPIMEKTSLPYASKFLGKMHACGHDGHMAMLLGAAQYLARTRNFNGSVVLIFQPAEEPGRNSGAQAMIVDGLFERFPCDAIFGLHNHPGARTGTFLTRAGPMMAAADTARVLISGNGGHASRPHLAVDPIVVAANIVMTLQTVVSRNVDPTETAVVSASMISGGTAVNIIPDTAELSISIRSFSSETRTLLENRIKTIVTSIAQAHGSAVSIDYENGYSVVVNSKNETDFAISVAREIVGEADVLPCPLIPGSEDFSYFLERKPGCFLRLGNGENSAILHSPHYDFNDNSLITGAAMWARLAERYLI